MRVARAGLVVVTLGIGCGPVAGVTTGEGGTSGAAGTSGTAMTPTTSGATSSGSTSEVSATELPGFVFHPDMSGKETCDLFAQDCPEGQKCVAHGEVDAPPWERWTCVPIVDDPGAANEPCVTMGTWNSGEDTCAEGLMCWQFTNGLAGVCLPLCQGSPAQATCAEPSQYCRILADDDLTPHVCFTRCDPFAPMCPAGQACGIDGVWIDVFNCRPAIADPLALFETCSSQTCDAGLVCAPASASAVECNASADGCCTPYCDLDAPTCPGAGQVCVPWFGEREPSAPEYADLGVCQLP